MLEFADGLLTDFDEGLLDATAEKMTVRLDSRMMFRWKNGTEVSIVE